MERISSPFHDHRPAGHYIKRMENHFSNIEIIDISTIDGKLVALVSYQDLNKIANMNNGYQTISIPINPREIQLSVRGNRLVDQSVKSYDVAANDRDPN